jgi:CDP-glucose 4,6-dehydratase
MLPDPTFWHGRRVLLTGHSGFKGAWTALWLHRLGAQVTGLALPAEPLSLFRLAGLDELMPSRWTDIRDPDDVAAAVALARPELVLHMAAQPLVGRSLAAPVESFAVNVMGTIHLLDALRHAPSVRAILVVTTDKVYANDESGTPYREADRLGGKDPYSASKAACEIATAAMARSFLAPNGISVATARGGNVIGGGDFSANRLVPDVVRAARDGAALTLRDPGAIRPWQHVLDCVGGYLTYLAAMASGRGMPLSLNFGPGQRQSMTVRQLADGMLKALGHTLPVSESPEPVMREAHILNLDSRLARRTLGWADRLCGRRMVAATGTWYRAWADGENMRATTLRQIADYEAMS